MTSRYASVLSAIRNVSQASLKPRRVARWESAKRPKAIPTSRGNSQFLLVVDEKT